jgi:hypothetical protein
MFRTAATGSIAASLMLCTGLLSAVEPGDLKKFGWHDDYASARAEARRTGRPMLLIFRCEP